MRGHTAHMVIMDEAAFMPETVIMNVVFPMLATTNGTAIMLSTPWGRGHIFYRSFVNPKYWAQRVKSEECPRITKEFLDEQRIAIGKLRYAIEYEAEFLEDQNALFPQDLIRQCVDDYDLITDDQVLSLKFKTGKGHAMGEYYLGCDLGKRLDYSVIAILRKTKWHWVDPDTGQYVWVQPAYRLVYLKQFDLRTKLTSVSDWIEMLDKKFKFRNACIDQTGIGEAVVERLEEQIPKIEGVILTAQRKQAVMMYLYTRVEQRRVIFPYSTPMYGSELITQMNEQMFFYGRRVQRDLVSGLEETGVMTFAHPDGRHDDMLWAFALAVYATRDRPRGKGVIFG